MTKKNILAIAFLTISIPLFLRAARFNFDLSYFILASSNYVKAESLPIKIKIFPLEKSYDGQFFMKLAFDPFDLREDLNDFKLTSYRAQRIMYPLLAKLIAFGQDDFILLSLIIINIITFVGTIYFLLKICKFFMIDPKQSLIFLSLSGLYMTAARSLSDLTALCFFFSCFSFYL